MNGEGKTTALNTTPTLPNGWRWVKLREVCKFEYGSGLPDRDRIKGSVSVYGSNGIVGYHNKAITQGKTIIIGRKGSIGQVNFSEESCWPIDTTYYIDTSKTECDLIWLYWLLKYLRLDLLNKATGVSGLNREDAYSQEAALPSMKEQKYIADKIQESMHEIEQARSACKKQLEATKALPSAYLRQVFSAEGGSASGGESLEAKKWERKRLGEICEVFSGSSAPQDQKYFEDGKYPFVRVQDVGRFRRTTNLVEIKDHINDTALKELNLIKAEKGTVLFPKSGAAITTNSRAILGMDAFIVSHLAAIKPKGNLADSLFIYYRLCSTDMTQYMKNPGYPSLKLSTISKIPISLPPIQEQRKIVSELKEKIVETEKLRTTIEKQLVTINAIPQAILRKAFRGEM